MDEGECEQLPGQELKRKRRDKQEIANEKLHKELNRIQREISASKNTKCEQYLYCNVRGILPDGLGPELVAKFTERDIPQQLIQRSTPAEPIIVTWERKKIQAYLEEDRIVRTETMESEHAFGIIVEASAFTRMVKAKALLSFVEGRLAEHKFLAARMTIIVHGKVGLHENSFADLLLEAYEVHRVQFRFVSNLDEIALLVAQMHRAIAKLEKKSNLDPTLLQNSSTVEKGIREGHGLVLDWWTRMLDGLHRFNEEQKRALVESYPDPFKLIDKLVKMSAGDAIYHLAEIQTHSGRRLGPVIAQKLYLVLTSRDGCEIIHGI